MNSGTRWRKQRANQVLHLHFICRRGPAIVLPESELWQIKEQIKNFICTLFAGEDRLSSFLKASFGQTKANEVLHLHSICRRAPTIVRPESELWPNEKQMEYFICI